MINTGTSEFIQQLKNSGLLIKTQEENKGKIGVAELKLSEADKKRLDTQNKEINTYISKAGNEKIMVEFPDPNSLTGGKISKLTPINVILNSNDPILSKYKNIANNAHNNYLSKVLYQPKPQEEIWVQNKFMKASKEQQDQVISTFMSSNPKLALWLKLKQSSQPQEPLQNNPSPLLQEFNQ